MFSLRLMPEAPNGETVRRTMREVAPTLSRVARDVNTAATSKRRFRTKKNLSANHFCSR
jgi:hypothetical protein